MYETDREIILILKEAFRSKSKEDLLNPDDLMAESALKWALGLSLLSLVVWFFTTLFEYEAASTIKLIAGGPISAFFGFLFLHLNNKAKNPSIIMLLLTWVSIMFGLYF